MVEATLEDTRQISDKKKIKGPEELNWMATPCNKSPTQALHDIITYHMDS